MKYLNAPFERSLPLALSVKDVNGSGIALSGGREIITNKMWGTVYSFIGKRDGDYQPSPGRQIYAAVANTTPQGATGGFGDTITQEDMSYRIGTFTSITPNKEIDNLLSQYSPQIEQDRTLLDGIKYIAKDKVVYTILQNFLTDGGKIDATKNGGQYEPGLIKIGVGEGTVEAGDTVFHELLHYYGDKTDSALWESNILSGADHELIDALEDRLGVMNSIKEGTALNSKCLDGYTTMGKLGEKIKGFIDKNDKESLGNLVNSDDFYTNYVHSGVQLPLSIKRNLASENPLVLNDNQVRDLANIYAYNANIVKNSYLLAIAYSDSHGCALKDAVAATDYKQMVYKFVEEFARQAQVSKGENLRTIANGIYKNMLGSLAR